jgi:hypothetical protein
MADTAPLELSDVEKEFAKDIDAAITGVLARKAGRNPSFTAQLAFYVLARLLAEQACGAFSRKEFCIVWPAVSQSIIAHHCERAAR